MVALPSAALGSRGSPDAWPGGFGGQEVSQAVNSHLSTQGPERGSFAVCSLPSLPGREPLWERFQEEPKGQ